MENKAEKRHTCIKCGRKRYESEMIIKPKYYDRFRLKVTNGFSWICINEIECYSHVNLPSVKRTI